MNKAITEGQDSHDGRMLTSSFSLVLKVIWFELILFFKTRESTQIRLRPDLWNVSLSASRQVFGIFWGLLAAVLAGGADVFVFQLIGAVKAGEKFSAFPCQHILNHVRMTMEWHKTKGLNVAIESDGVWFGSLRIAGGLGFHAAGTSAGPNHDLPICLGGLGSTTEAVSAWHVTCMSQWWI